MSFDLFVFDVEHVMTLDDVATRLDAVEHGGDRQPTERVRRFVKDLDARWPDIDRAPWWRIRDSPWSSGFEIHRDLVVLNVTWARAEEVARGVSELAERRGLTVFDPQEERVIPPMRLGGTGPVPWVVHDPVPGLVAALETYRGDPDDVAAVKDHVERTTGGRIETVEDEHWAEGFVRGDGVRARLARRLGGRRRDH